MSAATRAALVALIESVDGTGRVHAYERFAGTETAFRALYQIDDTTLRGWHVRRLSVRHKLLGSGRLLATARWKIVGLLSLVDAEASEILADELVDGLIAAERGDPTLGGVVRGRAVDNVQGLQLVEAGPVMFAGVLCHQVALTIDVQTFEPAIDGGLGDIDGAAGGLIGAVVARLVATTGDVFETIEGRLAFDRDDDPADLPAAIVVPIADRAHMDPTTMDLDERVDRSLGVIVVAAAGHDTGAGALAAGGLEVLRRTAREQLHGWGEPLVDVPLLYAGGQPIEAGPGLVAWREVYVPQTYIESETG